jgi:hypothetical protein
MSGTVASGTRKAGCREEVLRLKCTMPVNSVKLAFFFRAISTTNFAGLPRILLSSLQTF